MLTWRRTGFSGIVMGGVALAMLLPGCGGEAVNTTGPNPEVEIVEPVDAQGNPVTGAEEAPVP